MKGLKIALIAILCTLAIGLTMAMVGIMSGNFRFPVIGSGGGWLSFAGEESYFYGSATLQEDTEITADTITGININFSKTSCDVIFLPSQDGVVRIKEYYNKEVKENKRAKIGMDGGTLVVSQRLKIGAQLSWQQPGGYIEVYLPAQVYASLKQFKASSTSGSISVPKWDSVTETVMEKMQLTTVSGDIDVQWIHAENAQLTSTSGNITVNEMRGDLIMDATSGDLTVADITGNLELSGTSGNQEVGSIQGNLDMSSTSGDLEADSVVGDMEMSTVSGWQKVRGLSGEGSFSSTSGDIHVTIDVWNGNLFCESTSGSVEIALPQDSSFAFEAQSTSGGIRTSFDDELSFNKRHTSADGTVGGSSRYRIKVETTSGAIEVR